MVSASTGREPIKQWSRFEEDIDYVVPQKHAQHDIDCVQMDK